MRFRRVAAIAVIVAAVGATTAAVFPHAPLDRAQPMPPLTGSALAARYSADSRRIAAAASAAARAGDTGLARALDGMRGHHFLDFNPRGQGLAVEVIGNLARATRVAVIVPGSDTTLATFSSRGPASPGGAARALAGEASRLEGAARGARGARGARIAVVAWLGYATPVTLSPGVLTSGAAQQGSRALRVFVDDLARDGRTVALLCHSYGSVVCGLAAPHLPVSDIAVFGSPGMDASSARALHSPGRVWAGRGAGDWIGSVPHVHLLGLGFGQDPTAAAFGARPFSCGDAGHSGYFRRGSIALRNLADIALGDTAGVTR